jgi:hypothetical protein
MNRLYARSPLTFTESDRTEAGGTPLFEPSGAELTHPVDYRSTDSNPPAAYV